MSRHSEKIDVQLSQDSLVIDGYDVIIPNYVFIRELLPRSANGIAFRANDTILNRTVAIKIWIPRETDSRDRSKQALSEARKIAQLNHPNIVHIYQCSRLRNGWIYSIMEYIDGKNLRALIATENPDFNQRFRLWEQIEEALVYSHNLNIYHGDLHPGNVLITGETVKIIDFGTSIFALDKTFSEKRDVKLLIKLCKKLFHEYQPSLDEVVDIDISHLNSIRALSALSAWVRILFSWQEIIEREHSEDWLMTKMYSFSGDVLDTPIFSIKSIIHQLTLKGISVAVQQYFLGCCVLWIEVFLGVNEKRTPGGARYTHNIGLNASINEATIRDLIPSLREDFYKNGPFLNRTSK